MARDRGPRYYKDRPKLTDEQLAAYYNGMDESRREEREEWRDLRARAWQKNVEWEDTLGSIISDQWRIFVAGFERLQLQLAVRGAENREEGETAEAICLRKAVGNLTVDLAIRSRQHEIDLIVNITRAGMPEEGVRLEVGDELRHTGPDGIAMFESLREGRYQFHIIDQNRETLESTWVTFEAGPRQSSPTGE